jgi:hypothetical protein
MSSHVQLGGTMKRLTVALCALVIAGCSTAKPAAPPAKTKLTGRQQDSAARAYHHDLGESGIPGVGAINKAQKAADNESKRVNALDTIH